MSTSTFKNARTFVGIALARLRFVAVFLIAALVVGYWDEIANRIDKLTGPAVAPDALAHDHARDIEYFCPMHPDVIRDAPGSCPKCGMPLVKRTKGQPIDLPADVLARVQLTPRRIALAGIETTPGADRGALPGPTAA